MKGSDGMRAKRLARWLDGRAHYGWVVAGVTFSVILCSVGGFRHRSRG